MQRLWTMLSFRGRPSNFMMVRFHDSLRCRTVRNRMESATVWLGISGFLVIVMCMRQRVRGAFLVGILWVRCSSFMKEELGWCPYKIGNESPLLRDPTSHCHVGCAWELPSVTLHASADTSHLDAMEYVLVFARLGNVH